jgi:hypothetical protein
MAKDRQAEGCLSDEDITGQDLEGIAGRIRPALEVARNHDPAAAPLEQGLGAAQYVARRHKAQGDAVQIDPLPAGQSLPPLARPVAVARLHDRQGRRRGQDRVVARAGMIGVTVGDDRTRHRARRIDVEVAGFAVQPRAGHAQPGFRFRRGIRHAAEASAPKPGLQGLQRFFTADAALP